MIRVKVNRRNAIKNIGYVVAGGIVGSLLTHVLGIQQEEDRKKERVRNALMAIRSELLSNSDTLEDIEKKLAEDSRFAFRLIAKPIGSTASFDGAVSSGTFSLFDSPLQDKIRLAYLRFNRTETSSQLLYERVTEVSIERGLDIADEVKEFQRRRAAGETSMPPTDDPIVRLIISIQVSRPDTINKIKETIRLIDLELRAL